LVVLVSFSGYVSRIVSYRISSAVKTFRKIFLIDWLCSGFTIATNTNRTKKRTHIQTTFIILNSTPDLIRHRDIVH